MDISHLRQPLILTLKLDDAAFATLDQLRRSHFPPERNFLSAHVTLFHKLPAEHEESIRQTLHTLCAETATVPLSFPGLRFLGKGVAVELDGPALERIRQPLVNDWGGWLGAQDQQTHRPHVTIQNKVTPEQAHALYDRLAPAWQPFAGRGEGLLLWRYLNGPWELLQAFPFAKSLSAEVP